MCVPIIGMRADYHLIGFALDLHRILLSVDRNCGTMTQGCVWELLTKRALLRCKAGELFTRSLKFVIGTCARILWSNNEGTNHGHASPISAQRLSIWN